MAVWPNGSRTRPAFTSLWKGYPGHNGLDMINFDINHAVMGGTVLAAGYQSTGGGHVVGVLADNGDYHRYLHNKRGLLVRRGQRVKTGQGLGYQGTSGFSTGKHLHFAVRKGGRWGSYIDPLPYLEALVGSAPAGGDGTIIIEKRVNPVLSVTHVTRKGVGEFIMYASATMVRLTPELSTHPDKDRRAFEFRVASAIAQAVGLPAEIPTIDDSANGGWYVRDQLASAAAGMPAKFPLSPTNPFNAIKHFSSAGGSSSMDADAIVSGVVAQIKLPQKFEGTVTF